MSQPDRPVYSLFGTPINALSMADTLSLVGHAIASRSRLLIGVVNAAKLVNLQRSSSLREAMGACDITLADGMSVVWALRLLGKRLPERVPGVDLMHRMLEEGQSRAWRVYLFGATEEVSQVVERRIGEDYPGVVVAGRRNGFYAADQEEEIVRDIRESKPDILLVAMSPPKKEEFLARWCDKNPSPKRQRGVSLDVPVCHGVGGAFDVMAGVVKRAPGLWQRLGMEWFYRVVQEPRRMWKRYLVTNTLFAWLLMGEIVGRLLGRRSREADG